MKAKATALGRYTVTEHYEGGLRKVDREYLTGRLLKVHPKRRPRKSEKVDA